MLLRITDLESFVQAVSFANLGTMTIQAAMLLALGMTFLVGFGMYKRDERLVHIARRTQYLLTALLMVASAMLYVMIFDGLYVSSYVHHIAENQETAFFKVTGLWASQQGSLLFWAVILSVCGTAFAFANRHSRTDRRLPPSLLALFLIEVFFIYLMMFDRSNPFGTIFEWMSYDHIRDLNVEQFLASIGTKGFSTENVNGDMVNALRKALDLDHTGALASLDMGAVYDGLNGSAANAAEKLPLLSNIAVEEFADGKGMNPQLHNYWIAIHPPTLYLGYIGFTIPFCLAIGSLISGELDTEWLRRARLWTMASWTFLTAGIAMGGLWAYEILGWGGYWAWDPVENASFIPWLTATAFIHSVVVQERRGMLKVWNVVLIILTYTLTIIGTFLVRSGIISSVHAFGDTGLITPLVVFMVTVFLGAILLIVWRMPLLRPDRKLASIVSREGVFLINNFVLCLIALGTLTMTLWPVITRFLFGNEGKHEFAGEAYLMVNGPLFLLLIALTCVGPLLPYGKATGKELMRQLAWPLAIGIGAFAINTTYLIGSDRVIKAVDGQDGLSDIVTTVRHMIQFSIIPMAAMITAASIQEAVNAGRLRRKATKKNLVISTFDAVLSNRRRFGGYIAHIGIALVAVGIYISSFYEVDTSADLPRGGYTMIGNQEGTRYAFVSDQVTTSEVYRDVRLMGMRENQARGYANPQSDRELQQKRLWDEENRKSNPLRQALKMAHARRMNKELTLEEYTIKSYAPFMPILEAMHAKASNEASRGPFMNAIQRFADDRSMSVDSLLASMPNAPKNEKMVSSLNLAYSVLKSDQTIAYFVALANNTKKHAEMSFDESFEAFTKQGEMAEGEKAPGADAWERAGKLVESINSFEFIKSVVRIFPLEVEGTSDAEMESFREKLGDAQRDYYQMLQATTVSINQATADDFRSAADLASVNRPFKDLVDFGIELGPRIQRLLEFEEKHAASELPAVKAFNDTLRDALFAREALLSKKLVMDYAEGLIDLEDATNGLAGFDFRAIGGLRQVMDLEDKSDLSEVEQKAIDFARETHARIVSKAYTLTPQIKMFYDKRNGKPRRQGEAVRDPEIEHTLGADLYCILQDVDIKESVFNARRYGGEDRFIYRIFIKPGMNIGIAGLIIIILGSIFAALPASRRAPRVTHKAKAKGDAA